MEAYLKLRQLSLFKHELVEQAGSYLVRYSEKKQSYVLTLLSFDLVENKNIIKHYNIDYSQGDGYYLRLY